MAARGFLKRLRADEHADVQQDRGDGYDRDQRHHHGDDAEPCQEDYEYAGCSGIANAPTDRFPAWVANVNSKDERVPHQAADQADETVSGQHARSGEAVSSSCRAFDVVDRFHQIVYAEWD